MSAFRFTPRSVPSPLAELSQGPHLAKDDRSRAARVEGLQVVEANFGRRCHLTLSALGGTDCWSRWCEQLVVIRGRGGPTL